MDKELSLRLLQQMLRIRRFEEASAEQYSAGNIRGFLHLYIGEEAVATGIMEHLQPEDAIFATYREHGHALCRGVAARSIMAEMFGKKAGCCRGRGGSMHLFDKQTNFFGGNAIVAGALPLAAGVALAHKQLGKRALAACFFGEGAMAEGEFHETMNLAALWQLPVLFVCENNGYAMGTALDRSESQTDLMKKAACYNIRSARVDGMDVRKVYDAARQAVQDVKELSAPYFLECQTYRFRAHSMFDPELYRDKAEVAEWKEKDPISNFKQTMEDKGWLPASNWDDMETAVAQEIEDAIAFADAAEVEAEADLHRFVHWEENHG